MQKALSDKTVDFQHCTVDWRRLKLKVEPRPALEKRAQLNYKNEMSGVNVLY